MITFLVIHNKKHKVNNYILSNMYVLTCVDLMSNLIKVVSFYFLNILLNQVAFVACSVIAIELSETLTLSMNQSSTINFDEIMLSNYTTFNTSSSREFAQTSFVQRSNKLELKKLFTFEFSISIFSFVILSKFSFSMKTSFVLASFVKENMFASFVKEDMFASFVKEDMFASFAFAFALALALAFTYFVEENMFKSKLVHEYRKLFEKLFIQMTTSENSAIKNLIESDKIVIKETTKAQSNHHLIKQLFSHDIHHDELMNYLNKSNDVQSLLNRVAFLKK